MWDWDRGHWVRGGPRTELAVRWKCTGVGMALGWAGTGTWKRRMEMNGDRAGAGTGQTWGAGGTGTGHVGVRGTAPLPEPAQ